jgi:hydrogenase-4 component B
LPRSSLYAAHHALVKSGLFLGLGLRDVDQHPALADGPDSSCWRSPLAGAPLTSGALAKYVASSRCWNRPAGSGWIWR